MEDNILYEVYNLYLNKAKEYHEEGKYQLAHKNYYLAAESLLKIAKTSTATLRKAQYNKAKSLIEIADALPTESENVVKKDKVRGIYAKDKTANDNSLKEWISAEIPNVSFDDIVGLNNVKEAIKIRMINPLKYPDEYKRYNKKTGGGVLLYGPPGTGKTLIARAIAHEVGAKFYLVKCSDILSKWVGESEQNINALFDTAKKDSLAIIFLDEVDCLLSKRGKEVHNDKRVDEFLQQIDGFAGKSSNILLLGSTNRPWDIDSAALRSGRFSEKIYVSLPDAEARKALFKKFLVSDLIVPNIDWDKISKMAETYSGADIEEACDRASIRPLEVYIGTHKEEKITESDIINGITQVTPVFDSEEIKRFETFAGIDRNKAPIQKKETPNRIEIVLKSKEVYLLPNEKPKIEFSLSVPVDKMFINIEGKNYTCTKVLNNWISEELDILNPGEYTVFFIIDEPIASCKINFIKGMKENF